MCFKVLSKSLKSMATQIEWSIVLNILENILDLFVSSKLFIHLWPHLMHLDSSLDGIMMHISF